MLVDLTKKELKALCEFISYNNDIDKELDAIYDKLGGISNALPKSTLSIKFSPHECLIYEFFIYISIL